MSNLGQIGKMKSVLSDIKLVDTGYQRAHRFAYRQNAPVKAHVKMFDTKWDSSQMANSLNYAG